MRPEPGTRGTASLLGEVHGFELVAHGLDRLRAMGR